MKGQYFKEKRFESAFTIYQFEVNVMESKWKDLGKIRKCKSN